MTDYRPEPITLVPAAVGQFVLECVTEQCYRRGRRWTYTPTQAGDGLVLLPRWVCVGCGQEPRPVELPTWGA